MQFAKLHLDSSNVDYFGSVFTTREKETFIVQHFVWNLRKYISQSTFLNIFYDAIFYLPGDLFTWPAHYH